MPNRVGKSFLEKHSFWVGMFLILEAVGSILAFLSQPPIYHVGRVVRVGIGVGVLRLA